MASRDLAGGRGFPQTLQTIPVWKILSVGAVGQVCGAAALFPPPTVALMADSHRPERFSQPSPTDFLNERSGLRSFQYILGRWANVVDATAPVLRVAPVERGAQTSHTTMSLSEMLQCLGVHERLYPPLQSKVGCGDDVWTVANSCPPCPPAAIVTEWPELISVTDAPPDSQKCFCFHWEQITSKRVVRSSAGAYAIYPLFLGSFAYDTPRYGTRCPTPCKIIILGEKMIPQ